MIISMFSYFVEEDLLELRLRELDGLVDLCIAYQCEETHSGLPKPIHLDPDAPRWTPWRGKLQTVILPRLETDDRYVRENAPRHQMTLDLQQFADDDLVLLSDCDEIPSAEAVRAAVPSLTQTEWAGFAMPAFYYSMNLRVPGTWKAIALARVDTARRLGLQTIRDRRTHPPVLVEGGWHFSYLGGPEAIARKIEAFAHAECDTAEYKDLAHIARRIAEKRDIYNIKRRAGGDGPFTVVGIETLPRDVREHPERYAQHLRHEEAPA